MTTEHSHGTIRSSPDPVKNPIPAPPSPSPLLHPHPCSPIPALPSPSPCPLPNPHRGAFLRLLPRPSLSPRGSPSGAELWGRGSHRWSRRSQSPHCPRFGCATRTLPVSRSSQQLAVPTLCFPILQSSILSTVLHPSHVPAIPVPVPPAGTCRHCRRCPLVAAPRSAARIEGAGIES